MSLARLFTPLGDLVIRKIGDTGGAPSSRVASELDNIIAWAKISPRIIATNFGTAGSVGAAETDLMTFSVPANSLATNNDFLRISARGLDANNGNNKTVRIYYAGANMGADIATIGAAGTNQTWGYDAVIARTGAATAKAYIVAWLSTNAAAGPNTQEFSRINATLTPTHANANTFKITGQATNNNDVTQEGLIIELYQQ